MHKTAEDAVSITLAGAALAIAAVVVWRGVAPTEQAGPVVAWDLSRSTFHEDWRSVVPSAIRLGDSTAPIQIVEFMDLQCPFCRRFHLETLPAIRNALGDKLGIMFLHLPLPGHSFASTAAVGAECANRQGRFADFVSAVLAGQDSLGVKQWASYARDARIADLSGFSRCVEQYESFPRIDSGKAIAQRWNVVATPTIMVNGWLLSRPPSADELTELADDLLAGRRPFFLRE